MPTRVVIDDEILGVRRELVLPMALEETMWEFRPCFTAACFALVVEENVRSFEQQAVEVSLRFQRSQVFVKWWRNPRFSLEDAREVRREMDSNAWLLCTGGET